MTMANCPPQILLRNKPTSLAILRISAQQCIDEVSTSTHRESCSTMIPTHYLNDSSKPNEKRHRNFPKEMGRCTLRPDSITALCKSDQECNEFGALGTPGRPPRRKPCECELCVWLCLVCSYIIPCCQQPETACPVSRLWSPAVGSPHSSAPHILVPGPLHQGQKRWPNQLLNIAHAIMICNFILVPKLPCGSACN
jgi:hypothetical protein